MKTEEENKELVKRIFEALNNRDTATLTELYASDYGWYFPSNNPNPISREEEQEFIKSTWAGFPDLTYTIEELIEAGDKVIARFTARGTHNGEFQGMPATKNVFESGGMTVLRIKDGKVIEGREDYDLLGMMQQLGMELKPAMKK